MSEPFLHLMSWFLVAEILQNNCVQAFSERSLTIFWKTIVLFLLVVFVIYLSTGQNTLYLLVNFYFFAMFKYKGHLSLHFTAKRNLISQTRSLSMPMNHDYFYFVKRRQLCHFILDNKLCLSRNFIYVYLCRNWIIIKSQLQPKLVLSSLLDTVLNLKKLIYRDAVQMWV